MIPYGKQSLDKKDVAAVVEALNSDWITQGPKVLEFEKMLCRYTEAKYALAVSNGTSALMLAYLALGLKRGDEVITTPNTFVATTNMMLVLGAKPVFCDIRLDTYNIDESKIEKLITKKTKAIVIVDFAGQSCEINKIKKIATKHKLWLVEDAAHSLGSKYHNKKIGALADLTTFSFHPVKSITTGEGGAILTNNKIFYDHLKLLRSHGITKDAKGFNIMTELGYNFRMSDIQAALGVTQLKKINTFIKRRQQLVKKYLFKLKDIKEVILPQQLKGNYSGWHLFVIRTVKDSDRLPLYNYLLKKGIGVNFHYPAVYRHPYYRDHGYAKVNLKNADIYSDTAVTIPLFPLLKEKELEYVCSVIKSYFKK